MRETLLIGEKCELDFQRLITGRTFVCSVARYGKSWTARRIVEQVFGRTGIIILDPEGEYSTLRDKYPLLIIGKDVPVVPEAAEYLADQILDNDLSAIVDLSDPNLEILTGQEFVSRFINRFIARETTEKKPYLWILEEADEFAPEKGTFRSTSLQAVIKLAKKGGKRGMGLMALTQRPAFVSKYVISQCTNKLVGRMEWPDDILVIKRYLRIPDETANKLGKLEEGAFYVSGDFCSNEGFIKVGPVLTKHLGATPDVVPPAPAELAETLARLAKALPKIVEDRLAPAVPKVAEIEARIKEKLEGAWQTRYQRVEKQRDAIKRQVEAKYEVEIADLKRKNEELSRKAVMTEGPTEILKHPLVTQRLSELNEKQRALVGLLEKGAMETKQVAFYLKISPSSVPGFIHNVNRKIPGVIDNASGKYRSRLVDIFPVTEEAKAQNAELEKLKITISAMQAIKDNKDKILQEQAKLITELKKERDAAHEALHIERQRPMEMPLFGGPSNELLPTGTFGGKGASAYGGDNPYKPGNVPPVKTIPVDITFKHIVSSFTEEVSHEMFVVDEKDWTGKVLARGLKGFFKEEKGFGAVMGELERVYSASRGSGGTRKAVQASLDDLCAKGVLERETKAGQWMYRESESFGERVKGT